MRRELCLLWRNQPCEDDGDQLRSSERFPESTLVAPQRWERCCLMVTVVSSSSSQFTDLRKRNVISSGHFTAFQRCHYCCDQVEVNLSLSFLLESFGRCNDSPSCVISDASVSRQKCLNKLLIDCIEIGCRF